MDITYNFELKEDTWYQAQYFDQKLNYDVTIDGRIKSRYLKYAGKELGKHINSWGYHTFRLKIGRTAYHRFVHTILGHTFLKLPEGYRYEDLTINHKDGNKLNNHIYNLEWCTFGQNQIHKFDYNLQKSTKGPVDNNFYLFRHKDGREFIGSPRQFFHKFKDSDGIFQQGVRNIVRGYNITNGHNVTQHKGWSMVELVKEFDDHELINGIIYNPIPTK